jgi:hypothetical protein
MRMKLPRTGWITWSIRAVIAGALMMVCFDFGARFVIGNRWILDTSPDTADITNRLRWMKDRRDGYVRNPIDQYDPLLGWIPMANLHDRVMSDGSIVNTNSAGIRGRTEYPKDKTPGRLRIAVVGDSFSWGEQVNDDETYASRLARLLPGTDVMNFSVHGYGMDQMFLRLVTTVLAYHPDVVVFAYIDDDITRSFLGFRDYQKPKFVLTGAALRLTNVPIPPPEEAFRLLVRRPAVSDLMQLLWARFTSRPKPTETIQKMSEALLDKTEIAIRTAHAVPVFLHLPSGMEMTDPNPDPIYNEEMLVSFCRRTEAACFLARTYLRAAAGRVKPYDTKRHYEPYVHDIIAEGLADDLRKAYIGTDSPEIRTIPR